MSHHTHHNGSGPNQSPEEIESEIEQTRMEMSRTLDQIQRKLSPGQMVDEGIAYLRNSGGGEFASNFGVTVKNNPMPVALLGVGIAWLMMSGKNPPRRLSSGRLSAERFSTERYPNVYAAPESPAWNENPPSEPGVRERVSQAMSSFGDKVGDVGDKVSTTAHNAGERVSQYVAGARDGAANLASNATQLASSARRSATDLASGVRDSATQLRETGTHLASSARDSAARIGGLARGQYGRARSGAEHLAHEQPLVLGALGVALGAALGAFLPATRREDEWMGSTRDDLIQTGREQFEGAKDTLKEAAQKTREELSSTATADSA